MPIKGLSEQRRLPRLGKIRLGVMVRSPGGKAHPKATDHLVIPDAIHAAIWATPEAEELEIARKHWCRCELGEGPRILPVMLPHDAPEVIFPQAYKMYRRSGLWCSGNGEVARRWGDDGQLHEIICPCPYLDSGECGASATLNVVLPDVPGAGVYQITMGNTGAIVGLNSSLDALGLSYGGLRGIPFLLRLEPRQTQRWDDETKQMRSATVYDLRLDTEMTMRQIVEWRARIGVALQPAAVGMLMPTDIEEGEVTQAAHAALDAPAEAPWDISAAFAAAGRLGVNAAAYARHFGYKYGRAPADYRAEDVDEERALFRGLEVDAERTKLFVRHANGLTDAQVAKRLRSEQPTLPGA